MRNTTSLLATILTIGATGTAFAHAHLKTAMPEPNSTVSTALTEVAINFTEDVEPKFSTIEVQSASGDRVDRNNVHIAPDDQKHLSVGLNALRPGTYKVTWHATATDTHKTNGSFKFTVEP